MRFGFSSFVDFQIVGEAVDHHGGLLGAVPPVAFVAIVHQPERRLRQQRRIRALVREELDGVGRGFRRRVLGEIQQLIARRRPPRLLVIHLRGLLQRGRQFASARVLQLLERQPEDRDAVRRKLVAPAVHVGHRLRLRLAGERQRVHHVRAQIGSQLGIAREGFQHPVGAVLHAIGIHRHASGLRLHQSGDHVRGHERVALVGLPPAPSAVFVLEVVEAVEARANLLLHRLGIQADLQPQIVHRLRDHDIRQEARHGLLDAAVGERREIVERAEQRSGDRRRDANRQQPRARLRPFRGRRARRPRTLPAPAIHPSRGSSSRRACSPAAPVRARRSPHRSALFR